MLNEQSSTPRLDLLGPVLGEGFDAGAYAALRILPLLRVQRRNGAIPSFLKAHDQILSIKRAPKAPYPRIISKTGDKSYDCEELGLEEPISAEDYDTLGSDMADLLAAQRLLHIVCRFLDDTLSSVIMSTDGENTFNTTTVGATWDHADGDPYGDLANANDNVTQRIGVPPNKLLISQSVLTKLLKNDDIQSNLRAILGHAGSREGILYHVPLPTLAAALGYDEIIVGRGVKNTADEGQTATRSFIWPNNYAFPFRGATRVDDAQEVALGRTFLWDEGMGQDPEAASLAAAPDQEHSDGGTMDALRAILLEQYRDETVRSDILRALTYQDQVILDSDAAQLLKGV